MTRTMLLLLAMLALAGTAQAVDVTVSYLAHAKSLRTLEAADALDIGVFGDPACSVLLAQQTIEAGSVVIERVRTAHLRGAAKQPRLIRVIQVVRDVPGSTGYYAVVLGPGMAPFGPICQPQAGPHESPVPCLSQSGTDVYFTGCNVHIRNGLGFTHGENGLGNLIVGYNEPPDTATVGRGGSHNIIVGAAHEFSSHSSLIVGYGNTVSGKLGVAIGMNHHVVGTHDTNTAAGDMSVIGGGSQRTVSGKDDWAAGSLLEDF